MNQNPNESCGGISTGVIKSSRIGKILWFIAGSFFLIIGIIGIVIPLLPTTPFLLLALTCYFRSSKRMYRWMLDNRIFGKYLTDYYEGKGVSVKVKIGTISLLWAVLIASILIIEPEKIVTLLLIIIGVIVSIHIMFIGKKKI